MKHCAKKLLGLVFALALCLAVGGTALADGPEAADVWMLSDVWMLADEPNVTTAPDTTTVGDLANDGYTVTIPKTVEVDSTTNKGTLTVTAKLKQYRTLKIGIQSTNDEWQLKYSTTDENATDVPKVKYTLGTNDSEIDRVIAIYDDTDHTLHYGIGKIDTSEENYDAETKSRRFTTNFSVEVPTPSQATMSGTYSDTLTFTYTLAKHCVTYTINVYEQELHLKNDGTHIEAVDRVDSNGQLKDPTSQPKETYVLEYGCADVWGNLLGAAATVQDKWTRPRPAGTEGDEDTRCWEDLSYTMTPQEDYKAGKTTQTINLNLKRKWYWLDVNGATDYASGDSKMNIDGNQGGRIASSVNLKVSVDGENWSEWFWYTGGGADGDDYWGTFPYGIHFKLGLHHVKNGYVYDKEAGGGVKIIANGEEKKTGAIPKQENGTSYYVYEGTLTGDPIDTRKTPVDNNGIVHEGSAGQSYQRYCYIPCYQKGVTYRANGGTGGTEDVSGGKQVRSNVLYEENSTLKDPKDLKIQAPAGKVFAGWSTESTYTEGKTLYPVGTEVSKVEWETYTGTELGNRPAISGKTDDQKRELYAIWGSNDNISSSDTPIAGPTLAPGLSGPTVGDADADGDDTAGDTGEDITQPPAGTGLTLCYHANFVADDAVEEAVKTVACAPGADVVLKTCMFKRAGYTFTGWNTEKDGMGRAYKANGVPVTDWSDGDMVDLYAQWEKTVPLKPVVSGFDEDTGLFDPFAPPEELDPSFGIDPDADPADEEGPADAADAVDDAQAVADEEAAAAPPEELDFGFGIDPDAAVGGPAPFVRW